MKRAVRIANAAVCIVATLVAGISTVRVLQDRRMESDIAAWQAGRDISAAPDAPPALLIARAQYALRHGQVPAAQAIADGLGARGLAQAQADVLYALGNFNLRGALGNFTNLPFRVIAPRIRLAKAEYRQAIQLDPQNWDARYNYTLAAALVRDTKSVSPTEGTEMAHDRAAWPDIPGAPNGMP